MSTNYLTKRDGNIKLSHLLELSNSVDGFVVKTQIMNFDIKERRKLLDQLKERKDQLSKSEYVSLLEKINDSQFSYKKTQLKDFKNSQTFRIRFLDKFWGKPIYLFVYSDQKGENCSFCRYGSNCVVEDVINLISYHTNTPIFDEYTYYQMCDYTELEECVE